MSTVFFLIFALKFFLTEVEMNPYIIAFLFFVLKSVFVWFCILPVLLTLLPLEC